MVNLTLFTGFLRWSLLCCCTLIQKPFFSIMKKVEMAKHIHFQMWKLFDIFKCEKKAIWGYKSNQTNLRTCNLPNGQSIRFKSIKQFWLNLPIHMAKNSNICKSIFFAISTFAITEEMASGLAAGFLTSICSLLTPPVKMLKLAWVFKD